MGLPKAPSNLMINGVLRRTQFQESNPDFKSNINSGFNNLSIYTLVGKKEFLDNHGEIEFFDKSTGLVQSNMKRALSLAWDEEFDKEYHISINDLDLFDDKTELTHRNSLSNLNGSTELALRRSISQNFLSKDNAINRILTNIINFRNSHGNFILKID